MSPDGDYDGEESVRNSEAQVLTSALQRHGSYYAGWKEEGTAPLGRQRGTPPPPPAPLLFSSTLPVKTRRARHLVHLCLQSENQALFRRLVPLQCIQVAVKCVR